MSDAAEQELDFSLVTGSPLHRAQRRMGFVAIHHLQPMRRALVAAMFCWLPFVFGSLLQAPTHFWRQDGWALHLNMHVRCLVAVPIFVVAEAWVEDVIRGALRYAWRAGVIDAALLPACRQAVRRAERQRDSWLVMVILAGLVVVGVMQADLYQDDLLRRASPSHDVGPLFSGFARVWANLVVRPLCQLLILLWLWRLLVVTRLFLRLAKLDLRLVATHADGAAGLGFLERVPLSFAPVVFAMSALAAASWGLGVYLGEWHVRDLAVPIVAFVVVVALLFLSPCLVFLAKLLRFRHRALLEYGLLVDAHGRLVHRRWIEGERLDQAPLLGAAELGPVADMAALYKLIEGIRPVPLSWRSLIAVVLAAALPMVGVLAIEYPVQELLLTVGKALF